MNVANNLFEFLKIHNKAELIGFGTFVVVKHTAEFDLDNNMIFPPKRVLTFSKDLNDDMSFVNFMSKKEFISEQTSLTWIRQYSDSLNEKLKTTGNITLPYLGKISVSEEGNYSFEPLSDLNLMDESFGLDKVQNVKTFEVTNAETEKNVTNCEVSESLSVEEVLKVNDNTNNDKYATENKIYQKTVIAELISESGGDVDDIEELVDIIRAKADKILEVSQKMKQKEGEISENSNGKKKTGWKWLFILLLVLFIGSFATIGSYYMGWLQKYKWAKPISNTLASYMMTKDEVNKKYDVPKPVTTKVEPTVDTAFTNATLEHIATTLDEQQKKFAKQPAKKCYVKPKKDTVKPKKKEDTCEYTGAVQIHTTNLLGYDVITSTSYEKIRAENNARKGKSLGYDSYIITKNRLETPIYYVSYGSRHTLLEAKDLMQSMIDSLGGDYYIIARGETKQ
ncbi:MAG: hypothetical protein LBR28_02325 [Bacteroidales bacterium]|jgi:nucleoid DNA-binding protein|nr:hypothetical protein [Bacteroidales bacterium]